MDDVKWSDELFMVCLPVHRKMSMKRDMNYFALAFGPQMRLDME